MKTLALSIFIFLLYQDNYGQNLEIKIYNKTGYDVDSVSVGDAYVGFIKADSTINVNCNILGLQDGAPYGHAQGIIIGKIKNTNPMGFCGTGVSSVEAGKYEFDLTLSDSKHGYSLIWLPHW